MLRGRSVGTPRGGRGVKWISFAMSFGVLFMAILLFLIFAVSEPMFCTLDNMFTILRQASVIGLISMALMITVILGDFDISITVNANFAAIVIILLIMNNVNLYLAFLLGLACSVLVSLFNSAVVTYIGLPSFVATIAVKFFLEGACRGLTGGRQVYPDVFPEGFYAVGRGLVAGLVPVQVVAFLAVTLLLSYFMRFTRSGRYMHAIGESHETAHHVGINVKKVRFVAYVMSGLLIGLSGIIVSSMYSIASVGSTDGYLIPCLIATFLGASFLRGDQAPLPNPRGTAVSAVLLAILADGFSMRGVPFYSKQIIEGGILVATVIAITVLMRRRRAIQQLSSNRA